MSCMSTFDTRAGVRALSVGAIGLGTLSLLSGMLNEPVLIADRFIPDWTGIVGDATGYDFFRGGVVFVALSLVVGVLFRASRVGD
jgi:hypothetical protein